MTQTEKAAQFQQLHQRAGLFLTPNPWDPGSARILTGLGFEALATSSFASAAAQGKRDGELSRDDALAHARGIVNATSLPVSADLGNGFSHFPEAVAQTVSLAAEAGLVGCSIEDYTGEDGKPIYDLQLATERIEAAVKAARSLPFPFMLTARAENFVNDRPHLDDTIRRLVAYEHAGADVLFAPGLPDLAAVRAVCSAVSRPVNFMAGIRGKSYPVPDLQAAGVKRISFAASLYRAAMTGLLASAREAKEKGTFNFVETAVQSSELYRHFPD
jgi:2-methylisocitrate lyase-like PEP mutase family enzyme